MTTIVANREGMAADTRLVTGDSVMQSRKIFGIGNALVGVAGSYFAAMRFLEWFRSGGKLEKPELEISDDGSISFGFEALVLTPSGLYMYDDNFHPIPIETEFYSIGSGAKSALAAMHLGSTPREAIEVAALYDAFTATPVTYVNLKDAKKWDLSYSTPSSGRSKKATASPGGLPSAMSIRLTSSKPTSVATRP